MKEIEVAHRKPFTTFGDLAYGDIFTWYGGVIIKVKHTDFNCLNLYTGNFYTMYNHLEVCKAIKVTVEL
jgi:hypothetical protein